jgi:biopolymer transport protein ExbB/TolQ
VRFVIWAIPIMGFLGTVIGITEAIANLSPTQLENISGVVAGLGVAFDTTATALALSMVLMLIQFFVDRAEQRLLSGVDSAAWSGLAGRFQSVAAADGTALALSRLSEAVSRSSEKLLEAQEHSWRALEEAASGSLSRAVAASGQELRTALSDSLGSSLSQWSESLVRAQAHVTSQREDRWARAAEALTTAMAGFERHQQALADQTELLERVVDATRDVTDLERSLENNLSALTATGRFDETLATLSAAVQLLAARAADGAAEPRRVELHALPRSRRAA